MSYVKASRSDPHRRGIWLIAIFKIVKALLLLAVGIGALSLLHADVAARATHWINLLRVDTDNHFIHLLLKKLLSVDDRKLIELSVGTFFYAGLMLTEGIGLALQKRWAEYFTVFATASLIPLEIYELVKHLSLTKIALILINVAIVLYLIRALRTHPTKDH